MLYGANKLLNGYIVVTLWRQYMLLQTLGVVVRVGKAMLSFLALASNTIQHIANPSGIY